MATQASPIPTRRKVTSTVVTETIPANGRSEAHPEEIYDGDPWEVIGRIHRELEKGKIPWEHHLARVYRVSDRGDSESIPENNKFTEPFDLDAIRERFGGGNFKIWIYGPPERSKLVKPPFIVRLEGTPIAGGTASARASAPAPGGTDAVAMQALNMIANPEIMRMQLELMKAATVQAMEIVKSQIPAQTNPFQMLKDAKELFGPAPQAQNSLLDTIRSLKELGLIGSGEKKGIDELLEIIGTLKTSGLIPAGAPKADLATTFASNLPMLADRVVAGIHEMRLSSEAAERTVRLQRGEIKPGDPNVIEMPPASQAPHADATQPTAPAPAGRRPVDEATARQIITEHNLHRLVQGIKHPDATGQDMYDFLLNAWPEVLDELIKLSAENLLMFFKSRELQIAQLGTDILAEVGEDPRLPKMIEDFLRIAKENAIPEPASV
jgi:hypothetical protein